MISMEPKGCTSGTRRVLAVNAILALSVPNATGLEKVCWSIQISEYMTEKDCDDVLQIVESDMDALPQKCCEIAEGVLRQAMS